MDTVTPRAAFGNLTTTTPVRHTVPPDQLQHETDALLARLKQQFPQLNGVTVTLHTRSHTPMIGDRWANQTAGAGQMQPRMVGARSAG